MFHYQINCNSEYMRHCDLVPFAQLEKREKHPWMNVNFSSRLKLATLLKVTLLHGCFSRYLNCTNGTKSRKASHIFKMHSILCSHHNITSFKLME